ncbi:hypothetical protein PSECIP111854_04025 [Pseudoalteromonas sp. CIP111854]|uniref:Tc1-like transposase DDE domain-containing protein n=1 Tax=Pseudoalteromonas holothuriae TaxID=2963714 RepID=A0A9W4VW64_9GAMM|nr:hypothetical protein PSECIP111854_04025 [Pseudoalteromonas sp. CIP111854]
MILVGSQVVQSIQNSHKRTKKLLKNFQLETILHTPGHLPLERIDVWFQDEARFGQQNPTTRIWAETGTRPRVIKQQQFEYGYLFGAVCPATGQTEALVVTSNAKMIHFNN